MPLRAPLMISNREWRRADRRRAPISIIHAKQGGFVGDQQFLDDASGAAERAGFAVLARSVS